MGKSVRMRCSDPCSTLITDWEPHLQRICAFWSSVALVSGVYHGRPMEKRLPLPIDASHFDRWLELFEDTAHEICPPAAAVHFIERAHRVADTWNSASADNIAYCC